MLPFCKYLPFLILSLVVQYTVAQVDGSDNKSDKKGIFYLSFGSHLAFYSKSDVYLRGQVNKPFDFVIQKVRGHDDGGINFSNKAPQYSYALGYYFRKKNFGIEYNFDHVKYIMSNNQTVRLVGYIEGEKYNTDTLVGNDFIHLEHCDGGNYAMVQFVKWKNIAVAGMNKSKQLDIVVKAGAGVVIPKTESVIMGKYYHDKYAISGYVVGLSGGLRYNFLRNIFVEIYSKGVYANYTHFLIADGSGKQHWFSMQFNLMLGCQL